MTTPHPHTLVISDVHLGSKHARADDFLLFLRHLPADSTLVLNGDSIDRWQQALPDAHKEALSRLAKESLRRRVIWVRGNHDEQYSLDEPGQIEVQNHYAIGKRLFISHGHDFDTLMPHNRVFIRIFRLLHHLRILLGAESIHVALYAKKFKRLYKVLRRHVATNAVEYAKENGYEAVSCGHTHFAEDIVLDGIRYINTGSWTETSSHCLLVYETDMELVDVRKLLPPGNTTSPNTEPA